MHAAKFATHQEKSKIDTNGTINLLESAELYTYWSVSDVVSPRRAPFGVTDGGRWNERDGARL